MPPVRPDMRIAQFEGASIVLAEIPETVPADKPCYLLSRGMYKGSFIRTGDGDRLLSQYEIDRLVEERSQPCYDLDVVEQATYDDLDTGLVAGVLKRQRDLHPRIFGRLSDDEALAALNILAKGQDGTMRPTLAGLLALGVYPQHFYPRLTVTFTCFPGVTKAQANSVKYLDSQSVAGPVPAVLLDTVTAVRRNTRTGGMLEGGLRRDVEDYPSNAVREAVCNALMHRDYSPMGRGAQVQVNLYADRLEVLNPGGLYGAVTVDSLGEAGVSSTRNQYLAELLETTPYADGGFVAENRGTGFQLIEAELAAANMPPPEVVDKPALFSLTLRRRDGGNGIALAESRTKEIHNRQKRRPFATASERVFDSISSLGTAKTSELVEATRLSRSTVSYAIKKLLERGLIEPVPASGESKTSPTRAYQVASGAAR